MGDEEEDYSEYLQTDDVEVDEERLPKEKGDIVMRPPDAPERRLDLSSYRVSVSPPSKRLLLQVIDMEHQKRVRPNAQMDDPAAASFHEKKNPLVPCIRLYCKDVNGMSYCINTFGYYPVVHVLTACTLNDMVVKEVSEFLDDKLDKENKSVVSAKIVKGFPATPYVEKPYEFIEIKLASVKHIKAFSHLLRNGEIESSTLGPIRAMAYSCQNIIDKFQADRKISGFGWIDVLRYEEVNGSQTFGDPSRCNCELDANINWIRPTTSDHIVPLRKITFDIECLKGKGIPQPENDPVIVISAVCGEYVKGQPVNEKKRRVLFQTGEADRVDTVDQHECFTGPGGERDMLNAFGDLVQEFDPDYLCGHNIIGFDLPYIVTRAYGLGAESAMYLGRRGEFQWYKPRRILKKRKNGDTRETKMTATPGRIQLDTLNWIMAGFEKERRYTLNHLSSKYLGETKDDVGYSMIGPLYRQSNETRARLARYCMKDSELTEKLCDLKRYQMVISSVEMSRQTRVPAGKLLCSGAQVKVWSLIYEKAKHPHFDDEDNPVFFPDEPIKERGKDDKFAGAEVLQPYRGYYGPERWIGCGDFRSLYPSIIIDLNIDFGTELVGRNIDIVTDFKESPNRVRFISKSRRIGLLPQIEAELMTNRDIAKKQMKESKDPGEQCMFDKRQNEIKICCNTVYGALTASGGRLVRMELGEAITSQGRKMILIAKGFAENILNVLNHEKKDLPFKVIYGYA